MDSADYRIIPHQVAEARDPAAHDLFRYLISYTSPGQPRFAALDDDGRLILIDDEKQAVRFSTIAAAQKRLDYAIETRELQ